MAIGLIHVYKQSDSDSLWLSFMCVSDSWILNSTFAKMFYSVSVTTQLCVYCVWENVGRSFMFVRGKARDGEYLELKQVGVVDTLVEKCLLCFDGCTGWTCEM
jgi:hypothetical protein